MKITRQIFLVFLAYYGINCLSNVYFLFGPFYRELGASPLVLGLFLSIFYMAMMLCRPIGSLVTEKIGIRRALIVSSIVSAFAAAGIIFSLSNPTLLLFFRALSGVSASVFVVGTIVYQSMLLDPKTRGGGFALFTAGSMLPMATIVPVSEWILKKGYSEFYLLLPVIIALICLAISFAIKDVTSEVKKEKAWGSYKDMLNVTGIKTLYLTAFLMAIADGSTICAAVLAVERGVSVSWFMISASVSAILIRTVGFKIMDKMPRALLAAPAAALMGTAALCMSFSSSALLFSVFGIIFGLGIGMGFPTDLSLVGDLLPVEFHPKATGILLLAIDLGWVITPLIFGVISPVLGASGTFRVLGLFVLTGSVLVHYKLWIPLNREINSSIV